MQPLDELKPPIVIIVIISINPILISPVLRGAGVGRAAANGDLVLWWEGAQDNGPIVHVEAHQDAITYSRGPGSS
jgi:hypothetical protein